MSCKRIYGMATRDAYGKTLVELGKENPDIVALDADLSKSTKSAFFAKEFKDRFFNMGIAEANMVSTAAGLAACGKVPFASSFASFLMCKAFDQLRMSVANPHLNVKVVGSHGGISIGEDGASQMAVEDVALACSLPGFVVLVPADEVATKALVRLAAQHVGPVYIRTGRPKAPIVYQAGAHFEIGKANILREGIDITVIANGLLIQEAIEAACICSEKGIDVRVIDMHTVKPVDVNVIVQSAQTTGAIVTAEEHLLSGGLGAAVSQIVAEHYPVPMEFIGLRDTYAESGTYEGLFRKYGLTAGHIVGKIEEALKRK
ncbi:MAG: transketolase family protein [Nitrospirae bacterium]|nr:transketolase family protein [Nitrospirota bacterium]